MQSLNWMTGAHICLHVQGTRPEEDDFSQEDLSIPPYCYIISGHLQLAELPRRRMRSLWPCDLKCGYSSYKALSHIFLPFPGHIEPILRQGVRRSMAEWHLLLRAHIEQPGEASDSQM